MLCVYTLGRLHMPSVPVASAGGSTGSLGGAGSGSVCGGSGGSGGANIFGTGQTDGAFASHVLYPHGSYSKICSRKEPSKVFELYGTGRFTAAGLFGGGRFERAQSMLLACVTELLANATQHPPSLPADVSPPPDISDAPAPAAAAAPLPRLPIPLGEIATLGSLVGSSSAGDGKRLLALLQWALMWSRAVREGAKRAQRPRSAQCNAVI